MTAQVLTHSNGFALVYLSFHLSVHRVDCDTRVHLPFPLIPIVLAMEHIIFDTSLDITFTPFAAMQGRVEAKINLTF